LHKLLRESTTLLILLGRSRIIVLRTNFRESLDEIVVVSYSYQAALLITHKVLGIGSLFSPVALVRSRLNQSYGGTPQFITVSYNPSVSGSKTCTFSFTKEGKDENYALYGRVDCATLLTAFSANECLLSPFINISTQTTNKQSCRVYKSIVSSITIYIYLFCHTEKRGTTNQDTDPVSEFKQDILCSNLGVCITDRKRLEILVSETAPGSR
jgi:hypothetical protein